VNIREYISSGIVESYVLGLAAAEERVEFEQLCSQYPELMEARTAFEKALEKQAMENAIEPPAFIKQRVLDQIRVDHEKQPATVRNLSWLKYAAAASVLLLLGSLWMNISLYQKNKSLKKEYAGSQVKMMDMKKDMEVIQSPNIKMASMKGMPVSPSSFATVYWDTSSHDVYLVANNLPVPASDKQYQLWAIFNGKPVDLGVFDVKKEKLLIQAKNAQGAEAFAITLEKKGGSPDGPKGDMYVMGKL
jgi:anti-sigma-K factor RskA